MKNLSTVTTLTTMNDGKQYSITNDGRMIGYIKTVGTDQGQFHAWCGNVDVEYFILKVKGVPIVYKSVQDAEDAVVALWERARTGYPDKFFELKVTHEKVEVEFVYTDGIDFK